MVNLHKIYTRTGDDGTSGLVDGSRVAKYSPRMAAIGDVDDDKDLEALSRSVVTQFEQYIKLNKKIAP